VGVKSLSYLLKIHRCFLSFRQKNVLKNHCCGLVSCCVLTTRYCVKVMNYASSQSYVRVMNCGLNCLNCVTVMSFVLSFQNFCYCRRKMVLLIRHGLKDVCFG
jgi:hypothetical protein